MIRITKSQLFSLIVLYLLGSTTIFAMGIGAKRSALIVVLLASLIGLVLAWIYTSLQDQYPDQNLAEILTSVFGKWLSIPIMISFGLYFFYGASLNFYEFGFIIQSSHLPDTPISVILLIFLISIVYMIVLGVEVTARSSEILLPTFIFFLMITYMITLLSGQFEINELFPLFEADIKTILSETRGVVNFPFGELVLFFMFFHYLEAKKDLKKTVLIAVLTAAFFLVINIIVIIAILGPELAEKAQIPIVEVIVGINIADIIVNMDVIAVIMIFISGFYKTLLNFFGAVLVTHYLLKNTNIMWIISTLAIALYGFSLWNFPSLPYHRWVGFEIFGIYAHNAFQIIPILLLLLTWLKRKRNVL